MENNESKDYDKNDDFEENKENIESTEGNLPKDSNIPEENNEPDVNFTTVEVDESLNNIPIETGIEIKDDAENSDEEHGLTVIDETKRKNGMRVLIIVIGFLAITSFFASREFINYNQSKDATTTYINKVENIPETTVAIKNINRGEVMNAKEIYANNVNSVVGIQTEIDQNVFGQVVSGAASGTGFIISEDGYILTNYHVIENANKIKVNLYDGKEHVATLIGTEEELDIAVLKIDSENLKPVSFGDSEKIIVGEDIYAIGHPLGQLTYTFTDGIVSAKDREIALDPFLSLNMFQTNTALNTGNSGGPVFNNYGEVIGIATAKYSSDNIEGISFVIPVNDVIEIIDQLIEHGRVTNKSYLGITVTAVTDIDVEQKKMPHGAYVADITEGACADRAGIKIGDIIVKVDDYEILSNIDVINAKKKYKAGESATFRVWRSGEYLDIKITFDTYDEKAEASIKQFQKEQLEELEGQFKEFEKEFPNSEIEKKNK